MAGELDERQRRLWAAAEARSHGRGGIAAVARATGIPQNTIRKGLGELESAAAAEPGRVRRRGGGRKPLTESRSDAAGGSEARWSTRTRAAIRSRRCGGRPRACASSPRRCASCGHERQQRDGRAAAARLGYSLQANRKTREGRSTPIATRSSSTSTQTVRRRSTAASRRSRSIPRRRSWSATSRTAGASWRPKGQPDPVRVHDFRQAARQGDPLRRLRPRRRRGLGQRRDRPRHRPVRGRLDPQLVGAPRPPRYPDATQPDDHRRLRRHQRQPHPPVEDRAAAPGRRDRTCRSASATSRPAPASGTRSSTACSASSPRTGAAKPLGQARGHHQPDRRDHHRTGLKVYARLDRARLPRQGQGHRRPDRRRQAPPRHFHGEWNYTIKPRT